MCDVMIDGRAKPKLYGTGNARMYSMVPVRTLPLRTTEAYPHLRVQSKKTQRMTHARQTQQLSCLVIHYFAHLAARLGSRLNHWIE